MRSTRRGGGSRRAGQRKSRSRGCRRHATTTDLVGRWQAKHAKDTFELTIDEKNQFAWKATTEGKPPTTISGPMAVAGDALVLESQQQGTMVGRVTSRGPDRFSFAVNGAPPSDEGLTFDRVKGG